MFTEVNDASASADEMSAGLNDASASTDEMFAGLNDTSAFTDEMFAGLESAIISGASQTSEDVRAEELTAPESEVIPASVPDEPEVLEPAGAWGDDQAGNSGWEVCGIFYYGGD